jgi:hypothetical protein
MALKRERLYPSTLTTRAQSGYRSYCDNATQSDESLTVFRSAEGVHCQVRRNGIPPPTRLLVTREYTLTSARIVMSHQSACSSFVGALKP